MTRIALILASMLLASQAVAGTVIVTSTPRGASVTINGEVVGKTPMRTKLNAGLHDVKISAKGYADYEQRIEVGTKLLRHDAKLSLQTFPIDIFFKDVEQEGWAIFNGKRLVLADDGNIVSVPTTIQLTKGRHTLRLMKPGFRDIKVPVTVKEGAAVEVTTVPSSGYSSFARCKQALFVGLWHLVANDVTITFNADGTFEKGKEGYKKVVERGTYTVSEGLKLKIFAVFSFTSNWKFQAHFADSSGETLAGIWRMTRTEN